MQSQPGRADIDRQALLEKITPQQRGKALVDVALVPGRLQLQDVALVVGQRQTHIQPGQRHASDQCLDMLEFGFLGAQEFSPRRGVVENVPHLHGAAGRMSGRTDIELRFRPVGADLPRVRRFPLPGGQCQPRHRTDAGQGFAAKSHRADIFQVIQAGDLAGGVARQGQRQFVPGDADTVVPDPEQSQAALFHIDIHPAGLGVEGILDQLLDRRCRPLDDLAGSDLIDELRGQGADGHGE